MIFLHKAHLVPRFRHMTSRHQSPRRGYPLIAEVYIKLVADLVPKEANLNIDNGASFTKLWHLISDGLGPDVLKALKDKEALEGDDTVH